MERLLDYITRHPFSPEDGRARLAVLAYEASRARSGGSRWPDGRRAPPDQGAVLVDVRSQAEFDSGHILDARHVPQDSWRAAPRRSRSTRTRS